MLQLIAASKSEPGANEVLRKLFKNYTKQISTFRSTDFFKFW